MSEGNLGLTEAVSIALGGMIGGGIYAVLGVVVGISGGAVWAAFLAAGVVAASAAYSYNALNRIDDSGNGGSVTFFQQFVGNATLSGMLGWTLLVGYVGSMSMYAFAFGEFAVGFATVPVAVADVPLRPVVSVAAVLGFVGLNAVGARATGLVENVLVAGKVLVLVAFGVGGVAFVAMIGGESLSLGARRLATFDPVMAAAVSFVAFQGWQLLFYDQERIEDAVDTIHAAVYVSIPAAVVVYVLVGVATVSLAPAALRHSPHTALARAAGNVLAPFGLRSTGHLIVSVSALFSTGSAINATLFSSGYFAKRLLSHDLLPDRVGDPGTDGIPRRTLLVLGAVTAGFTAYGSLGAITSFASLSFIVVFGAVNYLAFAQRDHEAVRPAVPAFGVVSTSGFFLLLLYHLFRAQPGTLYTVVALAVLLLGVELLYFERDAVESELPTMGTQD